MGSIPIPGSTDQSTDKVQFGLWLLRKGNRESTVHTKLKLLKYLHGSIEDMYSQVLASRWCDRRKESALLAVQQYAEYKGLKIPKPNFKAYDNREAYVPNPSMIKQLVYRISNVKLRSMVLLAIETGATSSEVWNLRWNDINLQNRTATITGVKGHRTDTYPLSNELVTLLLQIPREDTPRIFNLKEPRIINDWLYTYRKKLAVETGNFDFNKIHFHTLRHFGISWKYFKTKDVVETQRFARHCDIKNTLRYIHIVKSWIKENEFDVVYTTDKIEFSKYLAEGYDLIEKTEWGYCLRKPKSIA